MIDAIAVCHSSAHLENGEIILNVDISGFEQSCEMFWNEAQRYYEEKQNARNKEWCCEVTARSKFLLEEKREEQGRKILEKKNRPLVTRRVSSQYYQK